MYFFLLVEFILTVRRLPLERKSSEFDLRLKVRTAYCLPRIRRTNRPMRLSAVVGEHG